VSNLLTTILTGLLIATLTSIVTVRLALWRFHSEKWWERKAELYSRLMEALFDMHSYNRQFMEDYHLPPGEESAVFEEKRKKHLGDLWSRYEKAEDEVRKIVVIGSFIVSDPVANDLLMLNKANAAAMAELSDSDPYDVADKCLKATEDCLANVREHAKNDLGITRKLPPILEKIAPIALSVARKMTH
jgi:hypothetical protein